jgi:hypothetical protein
MLGTKPFAVKSSQAASHTRVRCERRADLKRRTPHAPKGRLNRP